MNFAKNMRNLEEEEGEEVEENNKNKVTAESNPRHDERCARSGVLPTEKWSDSKDPLKVNGRLQSRVWQTHRQWGNNDESSGQNEAGYTDEKKEKENEIVDSLHERKTDEETIDVLRKQDNLFEWRTNFI